MKILPSFLAVVMASAACLVAQESAPKRKTPPPTEKIVEGFWIWNSGSRAIVKIPRETIEATLLDNTLKVKAGDRSIPVRDLPAGTKVYIKLLEELPKFTILEIGMDRLDVSPIVTPPSTNSNSTPK